MNKAETLRVLCESLDLSTDQAIELLREQATDPAGPTFASYLPAVPPMMTKGARTKYLPILNGLASGHPSVCWCTCERCLAKRGTACPCRLGECDCPGEALAELPLWVDEGGRFRVELASTPTCDLRFPGVGSVPLARLAKARKVVEVQLQWAQRKALKRNLADDAKRLASGKEPKGHDGRGGRESAHSALSSYFGIAASDDDLPGVTANPLENLKTPRRRPSKPRQLSESRLDELFHEAEFGATNDPELDVLICWFHLETGARSGGAVTARWSRVEILEQRGRLVPMIDLLGKAGSDSLVPISWDLYHALRDHGEARAGEIRPDSPLLYYQPRRHPDSTIRLVRPLTGKRYETLFARLRAALPWAAKMWLRPHDLRKTTGGLYEMAGSHSIARRVLGHAPRDTTDRYTDRDTSALIEAHWLLIDDPPDEP